MIVKKTKLSKANFKLRSLRYFLSVIGLISEKLIMRVIKKLGKVKRLKISTLRS